MNRPFRRARLMMRTLPTLVVIGLSIALAGTAYAQTFEIHEVDAEPEAFVGRTIRVDGRFRSAGAGKLYLVDSPIEFRLGPSARTVRRSMDHVELRGQLRRNGGEWVFDVAYLRQVDDEAAQFAERRDQISEGNYRALYDLAAWARQRADWYDDAKLAGLAADAMREALRWDEAELVSIGDASRLLALAARIELALAAPSEVQRLVHRAAWLRYERLQPDDLAGRENLARLVRCLLPGSQTSVPDAGPLWTAYDGSPLDTYRQSDLPDRRRLHRALYSRLLAEIVQHEARENPAELPALASRAADQIPDRPGVVAELNLAALEQRATRWERLSRSRVLALRDDFRTWNRPERGDELVTAWLDRRRETLLPEDVEQRLLLAADYRALIDRRDVAAELLIEAWKVAPGLDEIQQALASLNYELRAGSWQPALPAGEPRTPSPEQADEADEEWVAAGASEAELLARLRRPDRVARVATRNEIVEQWIYDGPPRLIVHLSRNTANGQARVLRLSAP